MNFGPFLKRTQERKQYTIDYTLALQAGDTLSGVTHSTEPEGLLVESVVVDAVNSIVSFYADGGTNNTEYRITFLVTTAPAAERLADDVLIAVEDPV